MVKRKKKYRDPEEKVVLSEEWRKDVDFQRISSNLPSVENTCQKNQTGQWKECDSYSWFKVLKYDLPAPGSENELNDFMIHLKSLASDDYINPVLDKAKKLAVQRESKKNKKAKDLTTYKVRLHLTKDQRKGFCKADGAFRWTYNHCITALKEDQGEELRSLSKLKKWKELRHRFITKSKSPFAQSHPWVFEVPFSVRDYAMQQAVDAFQVNKDKAEKNPNFKVSILRFRDLVESEQLAPEKNKNGPLCSGSYLWLFNSFDLNHKKKKAGYCFFMVKASEWSSKGYSTVCPGPFVIGDSRLKCEWNMLASDTNVFCKNYKWFLSMTVDRSVSDETGQADCCLDDPRNLFIASSGTASTTLPHQTGSSQQTTEKAVESASKGKDTALFKQFQERLIARSKDPESDGNQLPRPASSEFRICSIDPGVRTFATIYDPIKGKVFQWGVGCEKVMNENSIRLHRLLIKQRRAKSKKRCRIQKAVDRLRIRIENLVTDLHKKLCLWLAEHYDFIILPRFGTHRMVKKGKRKIGKRTVRSIFSLGHCRFIDRLNRKVFIAKYTEEYTSQTCSACGHKYKVSAADTYTCKNEQCKMQACRDCNGAKNILLKAIIQFRAKQLGHSMSARPANSGQGSSSLAT